MYITKAIYKMGLCGKESNTEHDINGQSNEKNHGLYFIQYLVPGFKK